VRLTEHVYLVGSGKAGFSLTDDYDCHVYALDGGSEVALIDAGGGRAAAAIVENLRRDGLDPARVRHLLLTHAHADHSAGTAALVQHLRAAGATLRVAAGNETAAWVRAGDERAISLDRGRAAGMYSADVALQPYAVETGLRDDDHVAVGDLRVGAIATPGHSRDHTSYLVGGSLFAGDALFFGGRVVLQSTWDCSVQDTVSTIERLAALEWDAFFPGHLAFSVRDGHRHVETAFASVRRLGVPAQMVI